MDDVVYLVGVKASDGSRMLTNGGTYGAPLDDAPFQHLRCAQVASIQDENGRPLRLQSNQANGSYAKRPQKRRLILRLDAHAYQLDAVEKEKGKPDVYAALNLLVRRRSVDERTTSSLCCSRSNVLRHRRFHCHRGFKMYS